VAEGVTALDVGCGMGFFSLALARLVGPNGTVIAADLQPEMLTTTLRRAARAGLAERIRTHRCGERELGLTTQVDFALAFWMVHETPDPEGFVRQLAALLRPGGHLMIAEPRLHVSRRLFEETLAAARGCDLAYLEDPKARGSRSAVFVRREANRLTR
jgi:2-polyprenyl-3-methyl-5-hydroxy-6-metoxy-1,4-benzoquinol methylase